MGAHSPARAVFLDRDGVLNRDSPDFVRTPEEFHLLPGAAEAVSSLSRAGYRIVVVSNQSGLARGYVTLSALDAMHSLLRAAVSAAGGQIAGIYYCPHLPTDACQCRKPRPGLVLQASAELGLDLSQSYLVGDKAVDIACGAAAGCRTVLVLSGQTLQFDAARFSVLPDHVATDLAGAAAWIRANPRLPSPSTS